VLFGKYCWVGKVNGDVGGTFSIRWRN